MPTQELAHIARLRPQRLAPVTDVGLADLKSALDACRRCPIGTCASQGVPGEGPRNAALMIVGEQPGDAEDLTGRPFVGPAGQVFDRAATAAGCLPLFTLASGYVPTWAAPEGQQRLADRAQHVAWLAGAGRPDFPAVAVLRVATGVSMRQACTAAGIDPDAPLVGIPAAAF